MQHSLKVENTLTHHHRAYNVLGTTQASFLATFKQQTWPEETLATVF